MQEGIEAQDSAYLMRILASAIGATLGAVIDRAVGGPGMAGIGIGLVAGPVALLLLLASMADELGREWLHGRSRAG